MLKYLAYILCLLTVATEGYARDTVVIATNDYIPYTSMAPEPTGIVIDIVRKAFETQGVEVEFKKYPWKRCEHYVRQGKIFAATPYFMTRERKATFDFSDPLIYSYNRIFYNKIKFPDGYYWNRLDDFKPYIMGGTLGYWYEPMFKKAGLKVTYSTGEKRNLFLLIHQRIDFTIIDEVTGLELLKKYYPENMNTIGMLKKPESILTMHLMISRAYPQQKELTQQFNRGLRTIKENQVYNSLLRQYTIPNKFHCD